METNALNQALVSEERGIGQLYRKVDGVNEFNKDLMRR